MLSISTCICCKLCMNPAERSAVAWRFHWGGLAERDMYAQARLVSLKMCYKIEGILFYMRFCFV